MRRALIRTSIVATGVGGLTVLVAAQAIGWRITGAIAFGVSTAVLGRIYSRDRDRQWRRMEDLTQRIKDLESFALDPASPLQRSAGAAEALTKSVDDAIAQTDLAISDLATRTQQISDEFPLLHRKLSSIAESGPSTEKQLAERINAFAQGILEEVAQGKLDADRQAREANRHRVEIMRNVESLIAIYTALSPDRPYPTFGGWAVSADAAKRLISIVYSTQPRVVLDVGSGVSTLLTAKVLELIGKEGSVIALEHDETWAAQTRRLISEHQLEHRAHVAHTPLMEHRLGGETFQWYDIAEVDFPDLIEVLFVDGPPKSTGPLARYPALPLLQRQLAESAVILMDDADRPEEKDVVNRWLEEFPEWSATIHDDEKGTAELRRESP